MNISDKGINLIKQFEGCVLHVYDDGAGYPTIGIGHLITDQDNFDKTITMEQAIELFKVDIQRYEQAVNDIIHVGTPQCEFDAMVSLCYNIGIRAFKNSSVCKAYQLGKTMTAANDFLLWNKAGGRVMKGLENRREAERNMFLGK